MDDPRPSFTSILYGTIVTHTVLRIRCGRRLRRDLSGLCNAHGPALCGPDHSRSVRSDLDGHAALSQPLRAALLAVVFYLLREVLFGKRRGWLIMWCTLAVLGILTPFSASWGGIEGMIFFNLPIWDHIVGWPEVFAQTLLLSIILTYWVDHPKSQRLRGIMGVGFILTLVLPTIALLGG